MGLADFSAYITAKALANANIKQGEYKSLFETISQNHFIAHISNDFRIVIPEEAIKSLLLDD